MGGTVAVTIRRPDGTVDAAARWTNPLQGFIMHPRFIAADPAYFKEFIAESQAFKDDWDANHETENFEFPMTPSYGYWRLLAPTGYGLVVIDVQTKHILSMQDYSSFDSLSVITISDLARNVPKQFNIRGMIIGNSEEDLAHERQRVSQLLADGRLSFRINMGDRVVTAKCSQSYKAFLRDALKSNQCSMKKKTFELFDIMVDIRPWVKLEFETGAAGLIAMKAKLDELGFVLSDKEQAYWQKVIQNARGI